MANNDDYHKTYEINPIILTGGIATGDGLKISDLLGYDTIKKSSEIARDADGNMFLDRFGSPVNKQTQTAATATKPFAYFKILDGTQQLSYSVAEHPVYNLETAATAVMRNPLTIQFLMIILASADYPKDKQHDRMTKFIDQLRLHTKKGGLFTLATPFYPYTNTIVTEIAQANIEDVKYGLQNGLHLTFRKPLVDLEDAKNAYNEQMDRLDKGLPPKAASEQQVMESLF